LQQNNGEQEQSTLYHEAVVFFHKMNFVINEDITLVGNSGKKHHFAMKIKIAKDVEINEMLVKVMDWKRSVGVDQIIRFERVLEDLNNQKGMIISNGFSKTAINLGKKRGLILYSRDQLVIPEQ
jgi:hypothetical protein